MIASGNLFYLAKHGYSILLCTGAFAICNKSFLLCICEEYTLRENEAYNQIE